MIMLKQQSKSQFSLFRLYTFRLLTGLFLIVIILSGFFPPTQTNSQQAEPRTTDQSLNLHALTILPSETPITPPLLPLDSIVQLSPTPVHQQNSTASAKIVEDYCLDIPVILYHHIQPLPMASLLGHAKLTLDSKMFDQQMAYLKSQGYQAISADDLVNALLNRHQLPEKSILITIDDGYDDNYTYGFLTAKKYQMIMNFMIPTQLIGKPGYMNWDHLREMHTNPYVRIYNHTASHAPLGYILPQQINNELTTSREDFKRELGFDTNIFTYPYGSYNPVAINALKQHGFTAAFTTDSGKKQCTSEILQLKRIRIGNAPMSTYGF